MLTKKLNGANMCLQKQHAKITKSNIGKAKEGERMNNTARFYIWMMIGAVVAEIIMWKLFGLPTQYG